ncbi:RHO GTPASE-ACTIVATING PROTEIN 7 [Salix purpurea]|uniref:RHO GTPASE-ACTIVATING PROTEIN 7 n=1 Tax=Salix purpurea TaxID=77065 RepID=A0A9Q0UTH1_SALPP|nr:RHO GTPASE-ACTIVATING PROTEIN 7 [Salix purpurea]
MTTNKNTESSKGDGGPPPPPPPPAPGQLENLRFHGGNAIFKSGPLFISSKGIGWTSWKKRWFILTRTSLVFFRSDPSAIPQKGSEVNLTLGGIDLNNSGSVAVKADKKLLTVLFHDGRDGRAFTLKAESSEDLYEWKTALENALARAPGASLVTGQNGIFQNDQADGADGFVEQLKDKQPVKSLVIGRPILLALEDVDGSPSFLEKALKFIEDHGVQVEGILRQAADVDDVEHRIKEFEQGITEFSPKEDAHVIADCVKYFLRELPSSPVPTSCCNALLEACRTDRGSRVNAMRVAICEMFPEPNRRLLQRILLMMQTVASHKALNRMSTSAVAACMAPLLLRPLLAGDCEIESNFNVGGDGSIQLLKAAAAANHAQAIVITLLEEYEKIFSEGSLSPGLYSDSDECGSEDEEVTDDDESYVDDATEESDVYTDDDHDSASNGTCTQSCESREDDLSDYEVHPLDFLT